MKIHAVNIFNSETLQVEKATAVISTQTMFMYRHYEDRHGLISIEPLSKLRVKKELGNEKGTWY